MKRIAIITEIPTPYRQPVFEALSMQQEYEFHFYFLSEKQKDRSWKISSPKNFIPHYFKNVQFCIPGRHTIYLNWNVQGELFDNPFDLYIIGGYSQLTMFEALQHCWKTNTPYIPITESHLEKNRSLLKQKIKEPYLRKVYSRSSSNLVTSSWAGDYVKSYGANQDRIFLFPNSIGSELYTQKITTSKNLANSIKKNLGVNDKVIFLYVGALIERKGVLNLYRGFEKFCETNKKSVLICVGEGPIHSSSENIKQVGFVQPDDLPAYYALADIFVFPSIDEPFGAVICEAMTAGLPIISSNVVGAVRDFVSEENGILISPSNVEELTKGLMKLGQDEKLRKKMGIVSKEKMKNWTTDKMVAKVLNAIQTSIETKHG